MLGKCTFYSISSPRVILLMNYYINLLEVNKLVNMNIETPILKYKVMLLMSCLSYIFNFKQLFLTVLRVYSCTFCTFVQSVHLYSLYYCTFLEE